MDYTRPGFHPTIPRAAARHGVDEFYQQPQTGDAGHHQHGPRPPEFRAFTDVSGAAELTLEAESTLNEARDPSRHHQAETTMMILAPQAEGLSAYLISDFAA